MPSDRRRHCRSCGRHDSEVGPISWAGYCFPCGDAIKRENVRQLRAHSGPFAERHKLHCIKAWGGFTAEEVEALVGRSA